jgi:choline dehydrogenase-like flavoprotein
MRRIPVAPVGQAEGRGDGTGEASGQLPKLDLPLARREFLKGSGILMGTIATGSVLAALAPSPVWAVELKTLSKAAGAIKSFRTPPYPSTHNLGTCRMGASARDGVCNAYGQAHDVANLFISDGSQFTTGGAENPTLTIVTRAIRQAEYIAKQMTARSI